MRRFALLSTLLALTGCGLGLLPVGGSSDTGLADEITQDDYPWAGGGGGGGADGGATSGDGGAQDGGSTDGGGDAGSDAPTLTNLSVSEGPSRIEVAFQASDDDIDGGALLITASGTSESYAIPGEVSDWRPSGTSTQYLDIDDCTRGTRVTYQVQVFDAAGHGSVTRSDDLTLSGDSVAVTEVGDAVEDVDNVGEVGRGTYLCGDVWRTGNDGDNTYTGDLDIIRFRPDSSGSYTLSLSWGASTGDYDLHLYGSDFTWLASSAEFGTTQPERVSHTLVSGSSYHLVVGAWSGGTGNYTIKLQ